MIGELGYLNLISNIIRYGNKQVGRNGNTMNHIGSTLRFSLENNKIPILTTKKLAWRACLKELIWFKNGGTNTDYLLNNKVKIWDGNSSREFLDSRGLYDYREGELGPIYGYQWRNWNKEYVNESNLMRDLKYKDGIDQLQNIIDSLNDENRRYSRRLIMTAWNPEQLEEMALPPCHVLCQFHVTNEDELSCSLYQRSGDVGLGVPFNIASYSFLTHILAKHCNLKPKEFIHFIGNAHIYDDHIEPLKEQIDRVPYEFPDIIVNKRDSIDDYMFEDVKVNNYKYYPGIKMNMRV
tara:strand:+ start:1814 stop:2695 length:882 start_codon:yes stop_codon:yes gene_type:complete